MFDFTDIGDYSLISQEVSDFLLKFRRQSAHERLKRIRKNPARAAGIDRLIAAEDRGDFDRNCGVMVRADVFQVYCHKATTNCLFLLGAPSWLVPDFAQTARRLEAHFRPITLEGYDYLVEM